MKKTLLYALALLSMTAFSCSSLNQARLSNAGAGLVTAFTLSDQQVASLSLAAVVELDAANRIAPASSAYTTRLNCLTAGMPTVNGLALNYKVYLTDEINAFATGDGSVRVYSSLMDIMDDAELVAIIGHEIGHIANTDAKDAMKNAYLAYAAREAVSSADGLVGKISDSLLGDLVLAYTDAQYSQKQEFAADDYGFTVSVQQGYTPYAMYNALDKLASLSKGAQASAVRKMFSSHPDNTARAARMKEKADNYKK